MSTVVMHAVASVDGYIAAENDEVGPLFDWYFNGDQPIVEESLEQQHSPFRISSTSLSYVRPFWDSVRATIQGRHLFDLTNGWEAKPPAGEHLLVVSHRPKPEGWHPEADVPFFDDVAAAVTEAKRRAGDGVVAVCAGNVGGQALARAGPIRRSGHRRTGYRRCNTRSPWITTAGSSSRCWPSTGPK